MNFKDQGYKKSTVTITLLELIPNTSANTAVPGYRGHACFSEKEKLQKSKVPFNLNLSGMGRFLAYYLTYFATCVSLLLHQSSSLQTMTVEAIG